VAALGHVGGTVGTSGHRALFFAAYNFVRVHGTIKTTPAVAAGLTDHVWSVAELLEKAAAHAAS
jgi:hypothetical protein